VPIPERESETGTPRKINAGLLTDHKGRRVLVQRVQPEPSPEPPKGPERSRPFGPHGKPSRDRRSGPRPSRPRSASDDKRK